MSRLKLKSTNIMETKLAADAQEVIPDFAKSSMAVQGAVQDGVHKNNEIPVATILEDSIAKWSTATKSSTLKKLQELCRERKIKVLYQEGKRKKDDYAWPRNINQKWKLMMRLKDKLLC